MASQRVGQRRAWSVDDLFEPDFFGIRCDLYGSTRMAFSVRGEPKSSSSFHELVRLRLRTHSRWQKKG